MAVAEYAGRAVIALVLGAVIGLERQWRQRMAGLRTNALVARFGRNDVALEAAVSRLSLEPSVSSVSWNVIEAAVPLAAGEE